MTAQLSVRRGERERAQEQAETERSGPEGHNEPMQSIGLTLELFEERWRHVHLTINEGLDR